MARLRNIAAGIEEKAGRIETGTDDGTAEVREPEIQDAEDRETIIEAFASSPTASRAVSASDKETLAASAFQKVFRNMKKRQRDREAEKGIAARRGRLFLEYLSRSETIDWANRRDRHIFLAAIPHLLLSVERVIERAKERKDLAKKQRTGASGEKLEQAMELQTNSR